MTMKNMSMTQATVQVQKSKSSRAKSSGSLSHIKNDISEVQSIVQTLKDDSSAITTSSAPAAGESNIAAISNALNAFDSANNTAGTYQGALSSDAGCLGALGTALDSEDQALSGNS